MYPFYVDGKKIFSFSYKPGMEDVIKDSDTNRWYQVTKVEPGRGRKIYGRRTINPMTY
ncbi:hypothetical protein V6B14_22715 (plasmid) [Sporosarcina psychrophila]|uniref:hypothetical protein n=1 Tax=Sporosarcina psychrophila TaxID=1476 RepID=UPI0030D2247E